MANYIIFAEGNLIVLLVTGGGVTVITDSGGFHSLAQASVSPVIRRLGKCSNCRRQPLS